MSIRILTGDCRAILPTLPAGSAQCVVTSPPYFGLRDYGVAGQIGLEPSPDEYVAELVAVFREVRRVLTDDGTLWLNLGDSYAGSWGAQSRGSYTPATLDGASSKEHSLSARQIHAHPHGTLTGSLKNTPGLKAKDLIGIPWRVAFALQADGWWLRQDIIWSKPNPMPESVTDRCTKAHEYLFMCTKAPRYFYDASAIMEPASENSHGGSSANAGAKAAHRGDGGALGLTVKQRTDKQRGHSRRHAGFNDRWDAMERTEQTSGTRNKRSVWSVAPANYAEAHFATFPPALIEPCILAGCPKGGMVLDPFGGAGTTGLVADRNGRDAILIELNPDYAAMAERRLRGDSPLFADVSPPISTSNAMPSPLSPPEGEG